MRLLRTDWGHLMLVTFKNERNIPAYAILSHTWLDDEQEVTFGDLDCPDRARGKLGWKKLTYAIDQACRDGYNYVWIDTCCIDKSSSAELTESINSMYRWYQQAAVCYVYLSDMQVPDARKTSSLRSEIEIANAAFRPTAVEMSRGIANDVRSDTSESLAETRSHDMSLAPRTDRLHTPDISESPWDGHDQGRDLEDRLSNVSVELHSLSSRPGTRPTEGSRLSSPFVERLRACKWFTRGWTLQEMLAPSAVQFFGASWASIGTLAELTEAVSSITGVHVDALSRNRPLSSFSIAQKMCWAADRQTTRVEDQAYSLLGIFGINLPIIYGEGEASFIRMQEELLRVYSDHTIFAWSLRPDCWETLGFDIPPVSGPSGLLATSVSAFRNCGRLVPATRYQAGQAYELTSKAVTFDVPIFKAGPKFSRAILDCRFEDDCTHEVAIRLTQAASGTYKVTGESKAPRVELFDTYAMSLMSNAKSKRKFSILRHGDHDDVISHTVPKPHQIMCRIKVNNKVQTTAPRFTMSPWGYINAGHWDAKSSSFYLHCNCKKDVSGFMMSHSEKCFGKFEGGLDLSRDYINLGKLRIVKRSDVTQYPGFLEERQVGFERKVRSIFHWSSLLALILPVSTRMQIRYGIVLVANYRTRFLHHDLVELVEISIYPIMDTFTGHMVKVRTSLVAFVLCVLRLSILIPSAAIPIATIALRQKHMYSEPDHDRSTAPDDGLLLGLKMALPLSCLASLVVSFKKDRIFGIGSGPWENMVEPIEKMRLHFRHRHRVLLLAITIVNNFALATVSIVLALNSSKHARALQSESVQLHSSRLQLQLYASLPKWATVSAVLTATSALAFTFYRFLCKHTFLKTIGGKTAMVSILFHVVAIVPFTMITRLAILTPWTPNDCLDGSSLSGVTEVYGMTATSESQSLEPVCTSFAMEGKLVLTILSLSAYDLIINIWTAGYIAWLVARLHLPPKKILLLL